MYWNKFVKGVLSNLVTSNSYQIHIIILDEIYRLKSVHYVEKF